MRGLTLREIFDASFEDEDFLIFVNAVVESTVEVRAEQRKRAESG